MPSYKFENFLFNTTTCQLTQNDRKIALRPKTAQLLTFFLENSDRVITKAELTTAIWHSEHIQDHALFQLISELRKLPSSADLIRTQPNKGYCWIAKSTQCTQHLRKTLLTSAAIAASIACVLVTSVTFNAAQPKGIVSPTYHPALPAIHAFSKGAIALEKGDQDSAITWFEFALLENPYSVETRLMLAESLYQQNRLQESTASLQPILSETDTNQYIQMAARDLMSRIHQQNGLFSDALNFAPHTGNGLQGAQCTADILDERRVKLKQTLDQKYDTTTSQPERIATHEKPRSQDYIERCNILKSTQIKEGSAACIELNAIDFYAYTHTAGKIRNTI
ncbi:MAG: DNA-binding winged helix-turn-helix (wHTH) protein [Flavobacteriales bacterium]|jgi:DNA-binding winged helix-turn-helix (wHTH) protein